MHTEYGVQWVVFVLTSGAIFPTQPTEILCYARPRGPFPLRLSLCLQTPTLGPQQRLKVSMIQTNKWPLPAEITRHIVELAYWREPQGSPYRFYNHQRILSANVPDAARYACVCREWREEVERLTFRNLRLDRTRLADVGRVVCPRRRAYVRTVDLDVELESYDAEVYGDFETAEEGERNSAIFSETLRLFFNVFNRWTPEPGANGGYNNDRAGISLYITAFSPSDISRCSAVQIERRNQDFNHRDIFGDRYIHSILQLVRPANAAVEELPAVKSVSELISGKERHISAAAWASIINSLPNVKKIDFDLWENEKKDVELRKRLRDGKAGNPLIQSNLKKL